MQVYKTNSGPFNLKKLNMTSIALKIKSKSSIINSGCISKEQEDTDVNTV